MRLSIITAEAIPAGMVLLRRYFDEQRILNLAHAFLMAGGFVLKRLLAIISGSQMLLS
jgi:Asp-tRNA(Asn)/Glu-tRNA(Gln) amidotransferase A subunit family amidase